MEPITLFYATGNKSKLHNMYYRLKNYPIQVVCPEDLGIHLEIEENGNTAIENALLKANTYFEATRMPTLAADSGVYIEGLRDEDQPGLYVRRVKGNVLTDDEMIAHYSNLAKNADQECWLHYFTGVALITARGTVTMNLYDAPLKLSPSPNVNRNHRGNPLDVTTLTGDGRYFNDLTDEERTAHDQAGERQFTDFIISNLLNTGREGV